MGRDHSSSVVAFLPSYLFRQAARISQKMADGRRLIVKKTAIFACPILIYRECENQEHILHNTAFAYKNTIVVSY